MAREHQISRRRREARQATPQEEIPATIFDSINQARGIEPNKQEAGPSTEELLERIAELNGQFEALKAEREIETARRTPQTQQTVQVGEQPKLSLDNLPDPIVDKEAYAAEIANRTMKFQNDMAQFNQRVAEAQRPQQLGNPDAMWEDFVEKYPAYAEDDELIRFATSTVAQRLAQRGIDVPKLMYTQPDRFFKEIVKYYDAKFGNPEDEDDEEVEDTRPAPRQRQRKQREEGLDHDDDGDGRDDIMGGSPMPGSPAPQIERLKNGDFIGDLQAMQRKSGYF